MRVCAYREMALSLTLVFFAGGGDKNILSAPEGQVSGVADAAANAYEHGTDSGRRPAGTYTSVSTGAEFYNAIKSNTKDILLTGNITLTSSVSTSGNLYWNDGSQCFMQNTPFSHKIYGAGYTITVQGPHTSSEGMQMNSADSHDYGGLISNLQSNGAIYDVKVIITKGFAVQTWETSVSWTGATTDYWLNVGGLVGYMSGGSQIDNVYVELADSTVRLASFKYISGGSPPQYVRAGAIVGEMGAKATITNVTVNNKGLIVAGKSTGNATHSVSAERWYGAVGNVVGWAAANGGNITIDNVRITGNGILRGYRVGNIGVAENSNVTTANFFDNFTGTYDSYESGYHKVYVNGEKGSNFNVTNVYRKGSASVAGAGETTATGMNIGTTLTVSESSAFDIYFDATVVDDRNNSLALSFNQTPSSAFTYTLKSGNSTSYTDYDTIGGKMVFRGLPTSAAIWNSSGNFTAVLESESVGPQHRQPDLQPYEHGYTTGTPSGTPINDGSEFEGLFSKSGTVEVGDTGTYYLTDDIVITGFTGKQFAGTLDGNGHTIYIAASDTALSGAGDETNGFAVGGLVGVLTGTIKNVRVVIDADITVGLDSNKKGRIGGVVGRLNGGTLDNVQVVIPSDVTISHDTGSHDSGMGGVVGQALGASFIKNVTVQMDGTLAPTGTWTFVSALVAEVPTKNGTPTINMDNIIVRGSGTFAAKASQGTSSGEPPYVSVLANFNNQQNYEIVNLDGLIYDFTPTISGDGSSAFGIFVNNYSQGNTSDYGDYVADNNLFIMQGRSYNGTSTGDYDGNAPVPLDSTLRTINTSVTGVDGATVAAYFMPGTGLVRLQVHSDLWSDERLTISGVEVDGKPIMSSLATAGDSSSDRYFSVDKSTLSGLDAAVQVSLFSNVTDPTVQSLTYTGSPLDIVIDMNYNGAPLTADDYSLSSLTATGGNALVQDGKPLNAGEYSVTITLNNPEHWFAVHGSGEASKTANVTFTVSPKNVTMNDPGDSMTAVYGEKYWILSDDNVWGLDASLFFAEEVGNVEYTATVTRTDDGSGYASTSGWLKAGSYLVALTINDSNYAINGNASVTYPLTITPVGLSYTLTVENSVAAVYDGNERTISGTPQGGDGIISAAHEGSAGTAGDSVTAAVSVTYGGVAAQIQNAGDYLLGVDLSGDDAENYTVALTASWSDGGAIENNTITVAKRSLDLQWSFDSNVALEYGDAVTDELIAETQISEASAIPYNNGSYTGSISFTITSATYNGGTDYAPGVVAAGTSVTFEVKPVLPGVLDENNYNISVTASGSGTKMVAQRTLTVNYDAFDMTAVYGDSISNEWLTTQYQEQIAQSITNIYNNDNVTFKIMLYSLLGGGYVQIDDFSALEMGTTYMAAVVVDGNDNYTIPNALSNGYDFTLTARTLTISGITWAEEGFDGVYDGQAHALKAVLAEGSSLKEGDEGVLELSVESITNVSDSGSVTVSVASKFADEYNLTGTTEFTVTLDKKTLTILPYDAANFLDHDVASLYADLTNAESGLITGVVEGDTLTFGGTWATVPTTVELGGKSYVAAGSYTLNMNPPSGNYKFENNAMSVTVNELDIGGAEVNVVWNENDLTYNAAEQSVTLASVTVNGVALPVEWFNLTDNTGTDADTYTATVAASNANITGSVSKEFTIDPVAVTVKWEAAGEISVGTAMPEDAKDMSALGLTARVTEFNAPGITDAAQYSIVVTASGFEAGHSFAMGEQVTLTPSMTFGQGAKENNYVVTFDPKTIEKAATAISVEVSPAKETVSVTYGDSVKSADGFISAVYFTIMSGAEGSALTADNFTVTVTDADGNAVFDENGLDAGTYTVTIEGKGAYSVSNDDNSFTYTVDPLTLTEGTWSGLDGLKYSGSAAVPVFTLKGVLNGDNVTVGYTIVGEKATGGQAINAGDYTVTAKLEGDDAGNYEFDGNINVKEFTIEQMVLQGGLTVDPDLTYDGTSKAGKVTLTWTIAPLKEGDVTANITFTKDGEKADPIAAGDYTAIVTLTDNTGNYDTTEITSTVDFTIEQLEVVLNWEAVGDDDLVYDGAPHELTATVSNKVVGDEVEVSVELAADNNNVNVTEQGFVYVAIGLTGADAGNYKLPENAQSEAKYIKPATLEISAVTLGENGVYDGNEKNMFLTVTYSVPPIGEDSPAVVMAVQDYETNGFTNAGEYTVNVSLAPSDVNYKLGGTTKFTVTIERANITVTVSVEGKTYDGDAVTPSVTVMFGERELEASEYGAVTYTYAIKDGDTLAAAPADASDSAYTVTANVAESTNFNAATSAAVEFKIERKILTEGTWSGLDNLIYSGSAAVPVFSEEGVIEGDTVTVGYTIEGDNATGGQAINAGDYTATAKLEGVDAGNYEFDGKVNVETFTIARKELTVLGGAAEFDFGVIGETTNTYKEQIASWDDAKNKVITGFVGSDTYTLGDIKTADTIQEVVYTDGKLNAGSYFVSYTVGDNYTISGGQTGHILLTVNKLSYEISLTYTIDSAEQSGWDGNISFEHDAPITLTFTDNALEITFNDGSDHTHVVTVKYDGTLPNVTFKLGNITINESNGTARISPVQSMNVVAQITPDDETNHEFTGTTSFNFTVKRNTRVEANEEYFSDLGIPSEYTGSSISVADISAAEAFTVTLGGVEQADAEVRITATLNGEPTDSICDAGKYVITATYTTGSEEVVTGTYEFTVEKAKLSFTLESAPSIVYGEMSADVMPEALKAFTATGVNYKSVTGTFAMVGLNENIYSNAGFVKAGSYNFTITFTPDDDNYAELVYNSADNDVKLTVAQKTITPFAISYEQVVSEGTTLTLTYAGKDAYEGNLDITPNGKFEDDDVEFMDEGNYSGANEEGYTPQIRIYESGDGGNYKLDLSGWKVVVLKKTIEVTVTAENDTYTGSAITLTASSKDVVEGDVVTFTVSGEDVVDQTVTNAGTYALTVTLGGEQRDNYEVAVAPSVTIGKASVDIVWTNEAELNAAVYNGQPYEATVDVMFNGQSVGSASIKYTSDEVTVTDGKAVNAGSYTATATFAGTDNFNAASEDYRFTIAKMVLDGKWKVASDMDLTYDGTSKAGYATWTWTTTAAPLNEGDVTVGYKYELNGAIVDDVIDAGNYNVYAVFTDNTGNYDTESGILQGDRFDELTVARRAVTVEWSESVSFTYNGAEQAPTATALNVAQGDSLTLTVTGAKKDVGTYTATVEAASVTGNYVLAADATVEFTIAPKSISVEWSGAEFTYDGTAHKPTATATGLVGGDSLTLTVTGAQTNAGSYTATVAAFEQGNYKLESTSTKAFTIKKADLTVTPASLEIRERETDVMQAFAEGEDLVEAFAGRISVSGVSGTVSYTATIAGDNNYDDDGLLTVGAHTFTIDAGGNYNAASVSVTVIATPVVTVIASIEGELVYNGSAFEISYALKEGAPEDVSMDDITVTASVETIVNAGEYTVTFTVAGSNEDYDYVVQDASGNAALTFTIAKRGLDVAEVAEAVYGNLQVSGTLVTGTHTAFVAYNDEEIELIVNVKAAVLSRAAAEYLDAGEHEVTIALANENGNFSLNGATLNHETEKMEVQSTLDVAPKSVTVGYTTSSKVYDAKGISITLEKFEDMLIEGDDPAVNIYINDAPYTGRVVLDAGEYTVRYESADPNYAFAPVSATFTVAPKRVTPNFDLNTGSGSLQITGGGKLEIEEGEETDIVAAIDNFMQSSGVPEEEMSIAVSGDLKLEDMATWAPGTYTVKVTLSGNHSGSMEFTVEVSEKVELPPPVQPELPETPAEAGSGNDWVLPLVIAIVALIDLALLVAIGVAAKKRA